MPQCHHYIPCTTPAWPCCCPEPALPCLERNPSKKRAWESFPIAGRHQGKVLIKCQWLLRCCGEDGCDVKSRWLCHRGEVSCRADGHFRYKDPFNANCPQWQFKIKEKRELQRERELEKTSDVWAVHSLNRILSPFPMKHQEVLKLWRIHLTPWGSSLTFPLHHAAVIYNTLKTAVSLGLFLESKLFCTSLHTELDIAQIQLLLKFIPNSSSGFTANIHTMLEIN